MRTWIKFCGITRAQDAAAAARLGVDAIGLVQVPGSRRFISVEQAAIIRARLPASVKAVLLFSDAPAGRVREAVESVRPDLLQFHGTEPPEFCGAFGLPYLRAIPMASAPDVSAWAQRHRGAEALLLDSHATGQPGGSGRTFDWSTVPADLEARIVLAGGLTPDNVADAVRIARPHGVDVSSGIERLPGTKDQARMQRFVEEVRRAEQG